MTIVRTTVLALLLSPVFLFAQSIEGDWLLEGQNEAGETVFSKVSFLADGGMQIDFGNDGSLDISSTYTLENDQVTLIDQDEESPCFGVAGIYQVAISDTEMNVKLVEDPCDQRRGDGSPMSMRRL